jgi:hypothetical protein
MEENERADLWIDLAPGQVSSAQGTVHILCTMYKKETHSEIVSSGLRISSQELLDTCWQKIKVFFMPLETTTGSYYYFLDIGNSSVADVWFCEVGAVLLELLKCGNHGNQ